MRQHDEDARSRAIPDGGRSTDRNSPCQTSISQGLEVLLLEGELVKGRPLSGRKCYLFEGLISWNPAYEDHFEALLKSFLSRERWDRISEERPVRDDRDDSDPGGRPRGEDRDHRSDEQSDRT